MSRRGRRFSIASNPVLIGAATTLVVIVAVFLAYNANNGLPFVPTYVLNAEIPNAANLVKGNDVRVGGTRVGLVSEITPLRHRDGSVDALIKMSLQTSVKPLPSDSTVLVRPRSALGLKYVEITKGTPGHGGFPDGARIPITNAKPRPVETDQVFNMFDARTRAAARGNLREFGNGLASRGADLSTAIGALRPLLRDLRPVMANLADPNTRLNNLFLQLGNAARIVAPVAEQQAELFRNLDTTFGALSDVARPFIQQSISGGPPALDEAVRSFRIQRPFLANATGLFRELRPGVRALRPAARDLADAFVVGTPTLRRAVPFNRRLEPVFASLQRFAQDPAVPMALKDVTRTVQMLDPSLKVLLPTQVTCNYVTLWFRNVASLLSEGDANGTWQRFIIIATPGGPNNEGGPSSAPANGPSPDNHLHENPYPAASSNECEAANETYAAGQTVIGNVPGNQGTTHDATKPEAGG